MENHNDREFERLKCLMLKAEIVSYMSTEVKSKITQRGYTPTEIATTYIARMYCYTDSDPAIAAINLAMLTLPPCSPVYEQLIFNESGEQIVDIIF